MSTNKNQTTNETANDQQSNAVQPTFTSTVKGLPIALAGEPARQPVRVGMKFQSADTVASNDGKTWIRIHVEGLSIPLFRNLKQAKADMSNFIDAGTAEHLSALGFEIAYNKHFRNKEIYLNASAYDVDSVYIADENSTEVKAGNAAIGDELVAKSAGIRIDGFIRAMLSEAENDKIYEEQLAFARSQAEKTNSGSRFVIGG